MQHRFPATHSFAQTNLQLVNQLRGRCSAAEIDTVRAADDLASDYLAGRRRGCGKPSICHAIGTASILASLDAPLDVVNAGLLHAAYTTGTGRISRERVRELVGEESEGLVHAYAGFPWRRSAAIPRLTKRVNELARTERDILLIRLANELEEYLDLGILHCEDTEDRLRFAEIYGSYMIDLAGKLGQDRLAGWLTEAFDCALNREAVVEARAPAAAPPGVSSARVGDRFREFPVSALEESISRRFERQARRRPEHAAVEHPGGRLSYRELDEQSTRLARSLLARFGPGNDPVMTLCGDRVNLVMAALGIFKAGKIWMPLDGSHPVDRLAAIADDAQAACMLADTDRMALARAVNGHGVVEVRRAAESARGEEALPEVPPDSIACVLYTSGSTGTPKGVIHSHRNLVHLARRGTNALRISGSDRFTLIPTFGHIAGVTDLLRALLNGATLLPFDVGRDSIHDLAAWLNDTRASVYHSSPSLFRLLMDNLSDADSFPHVRIIHLGGDTVTPADVARFNKHFSGQCVLVNNLGCTELSGYCQCFIDHGIEPGDAVPAGRAVEGVEISIRDEQGEPVPNGGMGEITVTSRYLALGYWRRPEETRAAFRNHGGRGRSYRTGDLGRMLEDGTLVHAGRRGRQVQIHGNRVEAGEVEGVIANHPGIARVAVKAEHTGEPHLTAYVVPGRGPVPGADELRSFVRRSLPAYMVPSVVFVEGLPLVPNGKIDHAALERSTAVAGESERDHRPPSTRTERELAQIWIELLRVERVEVDDDFFAIGGDSLLAMQLATRIAGTLSAPVGLHDVFEHATLRSLGALVLARRIGSASDSLDEVRLRQLLSVLDEVEEASGTGDESIVSAPAPSKYGKASSFDP